MKTAVEWLIDEHFGGIENCTPDFRVHIQQAKEMEKEQHQETFKQSRSANIFKENMTPAWESWEQYYNETFKQQEQ